MMTTNQVPDVSVVISTFNRAESLALTLDSLRRQQTPPGVAFEVIVVDNNSTDGTNALVDRLVQDGFTHLRYEFEARQGVSYGRNAGIRAARGAIVAFTDDDNDVTPGWVAAIKEVLDAHPEVAAVGGKILPDWPGPVPGWLDESHWSPLAILDYGNERFCTSANDTRCLLTANLAFRRETLDQIGQFSPDFRRCQDHELLMRLWRSGRSALYAPELVVRARIPSERLTKGYHRRWHSRHGYFAALMRLEEHIDGNGRLRKERVGRFPLFGAPAHLYVELLKAAYDSMIAHLRRADAVAFRRACDVRYFAAYLRSTVNAHLGRGPGRRFAAPMNASPAELTSRVDAVPMNTSRVFFVHALIVLLVGGSLYDIKTGKEHWPFSPYPMFSIVERQPTLKCLRLVGIPVEGAASEIQLLEEDLIHPFDQCRLTSAFSRTYSNPAGRGLIREQLRDCLARYESRRTAGQHHGPALRAVRLYEMQWTLLDDASNVDSPSTRRLVAEVDGAAVRSGL